MDCTLVVAVDELHSEELKVVWPTWKRFRPQLLEWPMIVIVDGDRSFDRWADDLSYLDHPRRQIIPWNMPNVGQREKMLSGLVFVPARHVSTDWYLKLDTDVIATRESDWFAPEWFSADRNQQPVFVTHPWGYTKPASLIDQLETWGDNHPALHNYPKLGLKRDANSELVCHPRIMSWCFFGNTAWTKVTAELANDRLPVPSQDTYLWYCAARRGDFFRTYPMSALGWQHACGMRKLKRLAKAALDVSDQGVISRTEKSVPSITTKRKQRYCRHSQQLAALLSRWGQRPIIGAELGVERGETSEYLLRSVPRLFLFMVDTWRPFPTESEYVRSGDLVAQHSSDRQSQDMRQAMQATDFAAHRRQILRLTTMEAAQQIADESLDFVFVDADHTYSSVLNDLQTWWPKIKPGGLLSGHDYGARLDRSGAWGVARAVNEFSTQMQVQLHLGKATVWWIEKSQSLGASSC